MAKSKKRSFVSGWLGLVVGLLALTGVTLAVPLAAANAQSTGEVGIVVMQTTPNSNPTPAPSTPNNSNPQATAQPNTNVGGNTNPAAPVASSDNSWLLWVILGIIIIAALAGGAWYYPRRGGTVVRTTETEYRDDGPVI